MSEGKISKDFGTFLDAGRWEVSVVVGYMRDPGKMIAGDVGEFTPHPAPISRSSQLLRDAQGAAEAALARLVHCQPGAVRLLRAFAGKASREAR